MKIAAIGDLHCTTRSKGVVRELLKDVNTEADVLVMAGDLTNIGLPEEMDVLLSELEIISVPMIAVVGNHDHENDHAETLIQMLEHRGVCVLNCSTCEIDGIGFIGTKGFCGGFDRFRVETFGERALKSFVQTSVDEAARLGKALESMQTKRRIAILHYAPVKETLQGESPELYPFLGSSLLADALERHGVDAIFHGHAHYGMPEGRTKGGIPVYNVARFVQDRIGGKSYCLYEVLEEEKNEGGRMEDE